MQDSSEKKKRSTKTVSQKRKRKKILKRIDLLFTLCLLLIAASLIGMLAYRVDDTLSKHDTYASEADNTDETKKGDEPVKIAVSESDFVTWAENNKFTAHDKDQPDYVSQTYIDEDHNIVYEFLDCGSSQVAQQRQKGILESARKKYSNAKFDATTRSEDTVNAGNTKTHIESFRSGQYILLTISRGGEQDDVVTKAAEDLGFVPQQTNQNGQKGK